MRITGWLAAVVVVLVAGAAVLYYYYAVVPTTSQTNPSYSAGNTSGSQSNTTQAQPQQAAYTPSQSIVITHTRAAGTDTYKGSIPLPACETLSSGAGFAGVPVHLVIKLTVIKGTCPAGAGTQSADQPFVISFKPTATTTIALGGLTINGQDTQYTVVEK